ncbi:lipid IV(A) 3-deoxy-D-manno-octulosonic acid transferase [Parachitinimonas caeni]|uniref:3-deoxy-D-manno-octulosonic acid transferase n=1 Tax=Parachitinimonas caeni TaxID=3031301 RepID=A0ABT7DSH2_9NEIS|nr:lipid IV(A) 3-deoxy-D-manno-octulosonic acid transferase [Parachitinimonas caeni]MDK2123021.1 lipid IV(A) 3-deoxy-D-manno-octulosonic acid transferase [Parachitinimonas caeni]
MIARCLYSLLSWLLTPLLLFHLWWRGRRQPAYRANIAERFGFYGARPTRPVIWLHAVSVGETRAAAPLLQALAERYPDCRILLTQMTPTGRETAGQLFGDSVDLAYLPYDQPDAVKRFLRHYQPRLGVIMETELWPNLIHAAADAAIPLYLVNARLSEKSLRGYQRITALIRPALCRLAGIAAASEADADRLARLMGRRQGLHVCGNLKYEIDPPTAQIAQGRQLRQQWGEKRPVWVCASTREEEEALLLRALQTAKMPAGTLTVIVPRHPQRFDEVAALLDRDGWRWQRRSTLAGALAADVQILLGDSMGELYAYYAAADLAFVGGSLVPLGSHSLIEPCALGVPVLLGPSTFNFAVAAQDALACGAARQVDDADQLMQQVTELLGDLPQRQAMGGAGRVLIGHHRGALARVLALLAPRR